MDFAQVFSRSEEQAEESCAQLLTYLREHNLSVFYFEDMTCMMAELALVKIYKAYRTAFDADDFPRSVQVCINKVGPKKYRSQANSLGVTIYPYDTEENIITALRDATSQQKLQEDCERLRHLLKKKEINARWMPNIDLLDVRNTLIKLTRVPRAPDISCFKTITISSYYSEFSDNNVEIKARAPVEDLTVFFKNALNELQRSLEQELKEQKIKETAHMVASLREQGFIINSGIEHHLLLWLSVRTIRDTFSLLSALNFDLHSKVRTVRIVVQTSSASPIIYHAKDRTLEIAAHVNYLQLCWSILGFLSERSAHEQKKEHGQQRTHQTQHDQAMRTKCPIDTKDEKGERQRIKQRITALYKKDPYQALDISRTEQLSTATRKYRFLVVMFHPDLIRTHRDMDCTEMTTLINEAWSVIRPTLER